MRRCITVGMLLATVSFTGTGATAGAASTNFARKIDIGDGRKMFFECRGTGTPTVVFESGYRNRGDIWSAQPDSGRSTICKRC